MIEPAHRLDASRLERARTQPQWGFAEVAGRLVELSGRGTSPSLTLAIALVRDAQRLGEVVAWVTPAAHAFYPPDADEGGVDLDALVVVRVPDARDVGRVADRLLRSGGFGLVVLDLGATPLPLPLQTRLGGLAQKHHAALLCLTEKADALPSLGSLVSLRVTSRRTRLASGRFTCEVCAVKDKHRGPTWSFTEVCRGPAGLC